MKTATEILNPWKVRWYPVGMIDPFQEMLAGTWGKRMEEFAKLAKEFREYTREECRN